MPPAPVDRQSSRYRDTVLEVMTPPLPVELVLIRVFSGSPSIPSPSLFLSVWPTRLKQVKAGQYRVQVWVCSSKTWRRDINPVDRFFARCEGPFSPIGAIHILVAGAIGIRKKGHKCRFHALGTLVVM